MTPETAGTTGGPNRAALRCERKGNEHMKKLWYILLCMSLLWALCACGGQTPPAEEAPSQSAGEPEVQSAPEETETPQEENGGQEPSEQAALTDLEPPEVPAEETKDEGGDTNPNTPPEETPAAQAETPKNLPAPKSTPKPEPKPEPEPEPVPEVKPEPLPETKPEPTPEAKPETVPAANPEPAPETNPEPAPEVDRKSLAQGLVGRPVSELYAAIGRPISSDYAPSCLDFEGEDGELVYDGFTVYTEKGPDYETVYAVF